MKGLIDVTEVIDLAKEFEVDQSDMLETFICNLIDVEPDELYELLEGKE